MPAQAAERGPAWAERLRVARGEEWIELAAELEQVEGHFWVARELLRRELARRVLSGAGRANESEGDLESFLARGATSAAELEAALRGEGARVRAAFEADLTPRVAAAVFFESSSEIDELRAGLALLRAADGGPLWLRDDERASVAARVELAAELLRAMARDGEALAKAGAPGARLDGLELGAEQLLAAAALAEEGARRRRIGACFAALERGAARVLEGLETPALRAQREPELRRREAGRARAEELLREVRGLAPDTPEGREAPEDLASLPTELRHGLARRSALEALAHDPLAAEPAYHVGRATQVLDGELEASGWFERFLALRGIRPRDPRSWKDRQLDAAEEFALARLLSALEPR